jgi:hypothetical protein
MHPLSFAKQHPMAVVVNMALGMMVGPAILRMVGSSTGVSVRLPSVGNGG